MCGNTRGWLSLAHDTKLRRCAEQLCPHLGRGGGWRLPERPVASWNGIGASAVPARAQLHHWPAQRAASSKARSRQSCQAASRGSRLHCCAGHSAAASQRELGVEIGAERERWNEKKNGGPRGEGSANVLMWRQLEKNAAQGWAKMHGGKRMNCHACPYMLAEGRRDDALHRPGRHLLPRGLSVRRAAELHTFI